MTSPADIYVIRVDGDYCVSSYRAGKKLPTISDVDKDFLSERFYRFSKMPSLILCGNAPALAVTSFFPSSRLCVIVKLPATAKRVAGMIRSGNLVGGIDVSPSFEAVEPDEKVPGKVRDAVCELVDRTLEISRMAGLIFDTDYIVVACRMQRVAAELAGFFGCRLDIETCRGIRRISCADMSLFTVFMIECLINAWKCAEKRTAALKIFCGYEGISAEFSFRCPDGTTCDEYGEVIEFTASEDIMSSVSRKDGVISVLICLERKDPALIGLKTKFDFNYE